MKKNSFIDKIKKTDAAAKSQRGRKPHIPFRLNLLFFVIFTLFVSLIVRLGYLQIVEGEEFNKKSLPILHYKSRHHPLEDKFMIHKEKSWFLTKLI